MKLNVTVTGVPNLTTARKVFKANMADAHRFIAMAGAQEFVIEVKAACPVRTGNLRDSVIAVVTETTPTRASIEVGPDLAKAPYAPYVELGTRHQAANPFIRTGFVNGMEKALEAMQAEARIAVEDAMMGAYQAK